MKRVGDGQRGSVLVTGAAGGIGSATVARLAGAGWRVFAGVRRREAGEALVARVDGDVVPVVLDVTSDESIRGAMSLVGEHLEGRGLDGLVNNAGLLVEGPLELLGSAEVREQFEVNVIGVVAVTREALPVLRLSRGRIVNIGSVTGRTAVPYLGASSASKAALLSLTDALRVEVAPFGVRVSLVEPTSIGTEIFEKAIASADGVRGSHDPEVHALYRRGVEAVRRSVSHGASSPVEIVAAAIERALTARRPRTRYPVGRRPRVVMALHIVPDRVRDRLLARELGLGRAGSP